MKTAQQILDDRRKALEAKQAQNDLLNRQLDDHEAQIIKVVEQLEIGKEALVFIEDLADSRRGSMKKRIETVITQALQLIYDKTYSAELTYSVKNNRSHLAIEMLRQTPQGEVRREIGGFGGGVADTMAVPIRLMVLVGSKQTDKVCILDESWKMMDGTRIDLVGKFLRLLADRLGIQVVFLSHHEGLRDYSDRVYQVSEDEGCSKIEVF